MEMRATRREFVGMSAMTVGGIAAGGLSAAFAAEPPKDPLIWSALLHLGANMWDDFADGPDDFARSEEEEAKRPNPF